MVSDLRETVGRHRPESLPDVSATLRRLLHDRAARQELDALSGRLPSQGLAPHLRLPDVPLDESDPGLRGGGEQPRRPLRPSDSLASTTSSAPAPEPEPINPPPVFNVFDLPDARPYGRGSLFG
jgi:hypothetical protein